MLSKFVMGPRTYLALSAAGGVVLCGGAYALVSSLGLLAPSPIQPIVPATVSTATVAAPAPAAPSSPPTPVAFEEALAKAANDLFSKANLEGAPAKVRLVIDPLIDGVTGAQSAATRSMEQRINEIVRNSYKRFEVTPFTTEAVGRASRSCWSAPSPRSTMPASPTARATPTASA